MSEGLGTHALSTWRCSTLPRTLQFRAALLLRSARMSRRAEVDVRTSVFMPSSMLSHPAAM